MNSPCVNCGADVKVCKNCYWYDVVWISKADYEVKLKADMVAILNKLRAEIVAFECWSTEDNSDGYDKYIEQYEVLKIIDKYKADMLSEVNDIIQQKIDNLKENENDK